MGHQKEKEMTKYLIEDLKEQHGKWLCVGEMFDSSKPTESERSRWTNDPHMAIQFDTREEAEEHNKKYWNMEGIEVTEHIFCG